jgi:hypothetical protein
MKGALCTRVKLCGIGASTFEDTIQGLLKLDEFGAAHYDTGPGTYKRLEMGSFCKHPCIVASCKMLTPEIKAPGEASLPITEAIDPDGAFTRYMEKGASKGERYPEVLYLADNRVHYMRQVTCEFGGEM